MNHNNSIIMSEADFLTQLPQLRHLINKNTTVTEIDDHFICKHCDDIVIEPEKCPKCEKLFCHACIDGVCPGCPTAQKSVELSRFERTSLDKVQFRCYKCSQTLDYEQHKEHFIACLGDCPANCGEKFQNEDHIHSCPKIEIKCDCC